MPALKRIMIRVELPGALKRSYPRINAGASTQRPRFSLLFFLSFPQGICFSGLLGRVFSRESNA